MVPRDFATPPPNLEIAVDNVVVVTVLHASQDLVDAVTCVLVKGERGKEGIGP